MSTVTIRKCLCFECYEKLPPSEVEKKTSKNFNCFLCRSGWSSFFSHMQKENKKELLQHAYFMHAMQ